MGIRRRLNVLGQMRLDVPHLRSLESSFSADFDALGGDLLGGKEALVVRGFDIGMVGALGNPAASLKMNVAGGMLLHPLASESGTLFFVDAATTAQTLSSTNARVSGSFTASSTNFVSVDLTRAADPTTSDIVQFMDALTQSETPKTVPLARTMDFRIVISTSDFSISPNLCPIAIVATDSSNHVTSVTDARQLFLRLGSGGSSPNTLDSFAWPDGRKEGAASTTTAFTGGDKTFKSTKDLFDALMSRLWEVGGGEHWYSGVSDRDLKLTYGTPVLGNGDNFSFNLGTNTLTWASLNATFANSTESANGIADGSAVVADGQCLYVDVDRAAKHDGSGGGPLAKLVPAVANLLTLGQPTVPGSRLVLAWRLGNLVYSKDRPYEVGRTFAAATSTALGLVKLSADAPDDVLNPKVVPLDANGTVTHVATTAAKPAFKGTGNTTGAGVEGVGGATGGSGVKGTGGATNGIGVVGIGGSTNGAGVKGISTGSGDAVIGDASNGTGVGGHFTAGGNSAGATAFGSGTGAGLAATSGNGATGDGLTATSIATVGDGLKATGSGGGAAVRAVVGPIIASTNGTTWLEADTTGSTLDPDTTPGVTVQNTDTADGTVTPYWMLHNGPAGHVRDGVGIWGLRIGHSANDLVALAFGGLAQSGAAVEWCRMRGTGTTFSDFSPAAGVNGAALGSVQPWNEVFVASDVQMSSSTNASTDAIHNQLTSRNLLKCWAYIKITGNGAGGNVTVVSGHNITSVSAVAAATGKYQVDWAQDFATDGDDYIAHVQVEDDTGGTDLHANVLRSSKTKALAQFVIRDETGATIDCTALGANVLHITVMAHGIQ